MLRLTGLGVLAVLLIFMGLDWIWRIDFDGKNVVEGLLALISGVLILIGVVGEWPGEGRA